MAVLKNIDDLESNRRKAVVRLRAGKPHEWLEKLMKEEPKFELKRAPSPKSTKEKITKSKLKAMKKFVKETSGFDYHSEEIRKGCDRVVEFLGQNAINLAPEDSSKILEAIGAARWQSKGSCDFLDILNITLELPDGLRSRFFIDSVLQGKNKQNSEALDTFHKLAPDRKREIGIDEETMIVVTEIGCNKEQIGSDRIFELMKRVPNRQKMEIMETLALDKRRRETFGKEAIRAGSRKVEIMKKVVKSIKYETCFEESAIKQFFEKKAVVKGIFALCGLAGSACFALCFSVEKIGLGLWGFIALDVVAGIVGVFAIPMIIEESPVSKLIFGIAKISKVIIDRLWWTGWHVYNNLKPKNAS